MRLLAFVDDLFFWNVCFGKGFILIPKKTERHLRFLFDTLQVFFMLIKHKRKDERHDQCAQNISTHDAVYEWEDRRSSQRNKTDVVGYDRHHDLSGKHNEKDSPVKGKDHAAKAGKPLTTFEVHIERENMSKDTRHARNGKDIVKFGKERFAKPYGKGCFCDIKQGTPNADRLTQEDQSVGRSCISRALFAYIKATEFGYDV